MPREDQLRDLLGSSFRSLERIDPGYRVTSVLPGDPSDNEVSDKDPHDASAYWGDEPAEAYARALLALIRRAMD